MSTIRLREMATRQRSCRKIRRVRIQKVSLLPVGLRGGHLFCDHCMSTYPVLCVYPFLVCSWHTVCNLPCVVCYILCDCISFPPSQSQQYQCQFVFSLAMWCAFFLCRAYVCAYVCVCVSDIFLSQGMFLSCASELPFLLYWPLFPDFDFFVLFLICGVACYHTFFSQVFWIFPSYTYSCDSSLVSRRKFSKKKQCFSL